MKQVKMSLSIPISKFEIGEIGIKLLFYRFQVQI